MQIIVRKINYAIIVRNWDLIYECCCPENRFAIAHQAIVSSHASPSGSIHSSEQHTQEMVQQII